MSSTERTGKDFEVVVVGSCNTDLISYVSRLPKMGETIHGNKFSVGFGGKGANQCVMSSRLGAKSAMIAMVGDDSFGNDTIKNFEMNNVDVDFVFKTSEAATGAAPIAVDDRGQNSIIIVSGANNLLSESHVKEAFNYITSCKVMLCQLEILPETTLAALKLARSRGVFTVLNPAPAVKDLDEEFLKNCDIFCPNETEAELITGLPVRSIEEVKIASLALLDKGCKRVIITLGDQGSILASSDTRTPVHIPVTKVKTMDSTGAGDCFIGSLAYYLALYPDLQLEEVIQRACVIASVSVCATGTQTSFPWKHELSDELF
ncbi:ribokinase-like isoform X2 [Antedon mediterranea]|uniref:ribokinase-like isoform X2 n=1 Tax=Antedon mediterranea TaxID=105859 RepID=UPI003AF7806E